MEAYPIIDPFILLDPGNSELVSKIQWVYFVGEKFINNTTSYQLTSSTDSPLLRVTVVLTADWCKSLEFCGERLKVITKET